MKKYIALFFAILALFLTACSTPPAGGAEDTSDTLSVEESTHAATEATEAEVTSEQTDTAPLSTEEAISEPTTETPTTEALTLVPEKDNSISSMEKLTLVDGVISVKKQTFSTQIKGAVAYKVIYESENGKLAADVVLPNDYKNKNYPVLIYFPQVGTYIESLASNYALNGIIVIRPYARGYDESEGMRDLGGQKDLADSQKLLEIFDSASFIKSSKIFVAGSSEGSVNALRLVAEDTDKRISGCAVVDVVADIQGYGEFRGDGVKNLFSALIGNTYEEAPEEYDLRSAVKFTEKLDRPILILNYTQSAFISEEQVDGFYELLSESNKNCTYNKIDTLSSDFLGEGLQRLLSWINKYD